MAEDLSEENWSIYNVEKNLRMNVNSQKVFRGSQNNTLS